MSQITCINVHSTNVSSENVSRQTMIKWVNEVLGTKYRKIEDLCKGDAYCQFLDMIFPGCLPIKKVKIDPNQEFEFIQNYKFVQAAFKKVGCDKDVPIGRLIKGRFQDNFEFVQWFHKFFLANYQVSEYEHSEAFNCAKTNVSTTTKSIIGQSKTPGRNTTFDKKNPSVSHDQNIENEVNQLAKQAAELKVSVNTVEKERDFYYNKLRHIEELCKNEPDDEFKQTLLSILYSDKEGSGSGPEDSLGDECF